MSPTSLVDFGFYFQELFSNWMRGMAQLEGHPWKVNKFSQIPKILVPRDATPQC